MLYRIFVTFISLLLPPVAVLMICGCGRDFILNCLFFLLAVIPSHIHSLYITCTYFHRRRKVKKGRYPGGDKSLIHSRKVINGGASRQKLDTLRWKEQERRAAKGKRAK